MKKTILILALLVGLAASAQVSLIPTTLSSAVTSTSTTTVVVAAATGLNSNSYAITAGSSYLYVDGEFMAVNAVSGTTLKVTRGYSGSKAQTHASGAYVFVGPATFFSAGRPGTLPQGSCTRSNFPAVPRIDVASQVFYDCIGGVVVQGQNVNGVSTSQSIEVPPTGAVLYTGVGTGSAGTQPSATVLYCTEINLPYSKLLTGLGVLNGGTASTDHWTLGLYDSTGNLLANTASTVASGTNVYQKIAFTSKYYAVGPAQYYGCLTGDHTGSSTVTMLKTGMQDTYLTAHPTITSYTLPTSFTAPTTFTSAVGPYYLFY